MSEYIAESLKQEIRSHFADCCAYCHTAHALMPVTFECEHIIPRSAGGKTVFENLCLACPMCNRYKSNRQLVPDPQTEEKVLLFHPHLQASFSPVVFVFVSFKNESSGINSCTSNVGKNGRTST